MRIGYGRVSTRDQNPDAHHDALTAAGCEQIFVDKISGKLARRPELAKALLVARGRMFFQILGSIAEFEHALMSEQTLDGLAGALRWYRAMPLDISIGGRAGAITVPTTYVWSTDDAAIGRRAAQLTSRWVTGPFDFKVLEGVSHWIPEQVPDKLAAYILERIRSASPRSTSSVWARRAILHAIRRCASSRWSVRGLTIGGS